MTNEEYINQIVEIGNTLQIQPNSPKGQTLKKCIELLSADIISIDQANAMIKSYVSHYEENKGEWIPVSERLPKPYEIVIRTVKAIGWNGTSRIYVDFGSICPIDTDVIAWQPLPEPYKAESEASE